MYVRGLHVNGPDEEGGRRSRVSVSVLASGCQHRSLDHRRHWPLDTRTSRFHSMFSFATVPSSRTFLFPRLATPGPTEIGRYPTRPTHFRSKPCRFRKSARLHGRHRRGKVPSASWETCEDGGKGESERGLGESRRGACSPRNLSRFHPIVARRFCAGSFQLVIQFSIFR